MKAPSFDEVYEALPATGWLTRNEAELLYRFCQDGDGPILEVGCYEGRSTALLASFGRPVYAVDWFAGFSEHDPTGDETYRRWCENVWGCSDGVGYKRKNLNVIMYHQTVEDWEPRYAPFAYLDGDHTYQGTLNQIRKARECCASYIAIHDVNDSGGGLEVKRAALELLGPWDSRVERLAIWRVET